MKNHEWVEPGEEFVRIRGSMLLCLRCGCHKHKNMKTVYRNAIYDRDSIASQDCDEEIVLRVLKE